MDPVFVILLQKDPKRSEHVSHVLQKQLSQTINIFSAIDGSALKENDIIRYIYSHYIYYDRLPKLISGQIGVALSVILLLENMVEHEIPHMCVLEDDALLCDNFEDRYKKTCSDLPNDYDFLYLFKHPYYYPVDHSLYKKPPPNFLHYINSHTPFRFGDPELQMPGKKHIEKALPVCGIVGFRVSLLGAQKILQSVKPIYFPIDDMIMHMVIKKTLNAFSAKKGLVDTAGSISAWDLDENTLKSNVWVTNNYTTETPQNPIGENDPLNSDAGQILGNLPKPKHADIQVSIIIPMAVPKEYMRTCAESIKKHTPEAYEIIFVVAQEEDGTTEWLKQHIRDNSNCKLVKCQKYASLATLYNGGIKTSKGEYIVLLSNDVILTEKWFSGMLECINISPDAGIVGPMTNNINGLQNVMDADYGAIDHLDDYAESFRKRYRHRRIPSRMISGICMLFRRDLIKQIGFSDEHFRAGGIENEEFCLRAALEGHTNLIAGDVFIYHCGNTRFVENDPNYNSIKSHDKKLLAEKWSGIDTESPLGKKLFTLNTLEKAYEAYQKGDIDNSVDMFLKGIGHCPDDERLYHTLSKILIDANLFKDALDVLNEMPPNRQDLKRLELAGYCKAGMALYEEAEEYADRMLSLNPGAAPALNLKGVLAFKKGKENEAKTFFNKAIASDPGYGEPYTNLGSLKLDAGQKEEALNLIERGFILSPTVTDVFTAYHSAISSPGAFARAEPVFREANAFHPHHEKLKMLFIDILLQQGKYDAAMKEIEDAMVTFAIDDGFLSASLRVRDILGAKKIDKDSVEKGTVSLCMIVKNEAEDLAKCLGSVKPVVDEMIVVDTGSIDRTKDIAKVFGAKVFDFEWTHDFSEARNFSISKASGDWIFLLDADEVVSSLDHDHFLMTVRKPSPKPVAYSLVTRNYMARANTIGWIANDGKYDSEEAADGWIPSSKVRLFPNDPHIRFEYPVHEMVEPSLARGDIAVKKGSIPIHHYGKLNKEKSDCKGEAYYLIGRKKLDEMGDDIIAIRELAIQAGLLKKWEEAIELWQRLIGIRPRTPEAFVNMGTAYWHLGEYQNALSAAKKAMALAPHMNESAYNYAICELHLGNAEHAVSLLEDLLDRSPEYLPAQFMLTAAYCCDGNKEKGLKGFEKLRKAHTGAYLAVSCHELAKGLISAKRAEYAILLLEAAIESKNINKDVLALFSECLEMRKCTAW